MSDIGSTSAGSGMSAGKLQPLLIVEDDLAAKANQVVARWICFRCGA